MAVYIQRMHVSRFAHALARASMCQTKKLCIKMRNHLSMVFQHFKLFPHWQWSAITSQKQPMRVKVFAAEPRNCRKTLLQCGLSYKAGQLSKWFIWWSKTTSGHCRCTCDEPLILFAGLNYLSFRPAELVDEVWLLFRNLVKEESCTWLLHNPWNVLCSVKSVTSCASFDKGAA